MDSTTSDPPPEPSLLEQFGAWLDAFPTVPPWMQWLLATFTFWAVIGAPIIIWLWRRWGANWWAARSRESAEKRSAKLGKNVIRAHALCRNRPAMLIRLAVFLAGCVAISMFGVLGMIIGSSLYVPEWPGGQPPSDNEVKARVFLSIMLFVAAYIAGLAISVWFVRSLAPLFNIERYTQRSRERIESLFTRAGVPQEVASKRLKSFDDVVDKVRKREIR